MTTQQTDWIEYDGSDEQIAELLQAKQFVVDSENSTFYKPTILNMPVTETYVTWLRQMLENAEVTAYWIIPADPLREMKIRWSMTGQPVWIREHLANYFDGYLESTDCYDREPTTTPDWNIPNAEYSFKPWED